MRVVISSSIEAQVSSSLGELRVLEPSRKTFMSAFQRRQLLFLSVMPSPRSLTTWQGTGGGLVRWVDESGLKEVGEHVIVEFLGPLELVLGNL